ncbi:MAG: phosphate ABC transporter permease PstA [Solirubrobacterales bacterium]|nr:phosphate ABC transporter permease PstA [Solirubrobacterales bacterium]
MAVDPGLPGAARTQLAVAGARATTAAALNRKGSGPRVQEGLFLALLLLAVGFALAGLAALLVWSFVEGLPRLDANLFTQGPSSLHPETAGFRTAILGSVYVIGGVIALIVPLGVGAAIYLEEYADKTRWWNRFIELNVQNLAGVPSIVYGILGLAFIVRGPLDIGFVAAAGSMTLALLVLPTVILAAREAIRAVPPSIREGALALGATQWQTVRRQVLPAAIPGILTGIILGVARAIGEAAPLLLVGAVTFVTVNPSLFEGRFTTLPVQIFNYAGRPQEVFHELAAAGVIVMLVVLLAMNSFAIWLRNHYEKKLS